jgi:hypothetical protein
MTLPPLEQEVADPLVEVLICGRPRLDDPIIDQARSRRLIKFRSTILLPIGGLTSPIDKSYTSCVRKPGSRLREEVEPFLPRKPQVGEK